ncbi:MULTISPECIES: hypothetical protein [unclassified Polaribacter]|uniref:hypothetical protein n=1 Tax=unclassified Polaribacter TaxID=196858 RepID=UPI0016789DD7|nr:MULTISPECIES: hypothetical protein [unclassified Polaribacter]
MKNNNEAKRTVFGLLFGVVLVSLMENTGLGSGIGLLCSVAIGNILNQKDKIRFTSF